jgi:hypothetical protein
MKGNERRGCRPLINYRFACFEAQAVVLAEKQLPRFARDDMLSPGLDSTAAHTPAQGDAVLLQLPH